MLCIQYIILKWTTLHDEFFRFSFGNLSVFNAYMQVPVLTFKLMYVSLLQLVKTGLILMDLCTP